MNAVKLAVVAATLGVVTAFADTDIYGNVIQYNDKGEVTYKYWRSDQKAEELSGAGSVSANASPSADFEPRYLTWAMSDGECPARGLFVIIY